MREIANVVALTARLAIRPWTSADAEALFDIYSRWEVARWLGATPRAMDTMDQAGRRIEAWAAVSEPDPTYGVWCVLRRDTGTAVGTVLLIPLPDGAGEVEVGWHLHPDHWGNGYATEAARAVVQRGFDAGLDEVLAVVNPDNDPSQAGCRRLGMEHLGTTTRYYGMPLELFRTTKGSPSAPISQR
jgi:RimJ/RimL family protein N-acetyltransferase